MKTNSLYIKLIKGDGNPHKCVNDILKSNSGKEYIRLAHLLGKKNNRLSFIVYNRLFPDAFLLIKHPYYDGIKFEKLLLWDTCLIKEFKDEINAFVGLKKDFENSILEGDFKCAKDTLELIERNYGRSLWLLESKSILSNLGVKTDYTDLCDFEKLYLSYLSYKNDINIRNHFYPERMKKTIRKNIKEPEIISFFDYKLLVERSSLAWNEVLFFGNQFSLIDIYLLIIDVLQELDSFDISKSITDNSFKNLSEINDEIISIIYSRYHSNDYNFNDPQLSIIKTFDEDYVTVSDEILLNKKYYIQSIYAYYLVNIASINSNREINFGDCLASDILLAMKSIMQKHNIDKVINSINSLSIFSRVLASFAIGKSVLIFLNEMLDVHVLIGNACKFTSYLDIKLFYSIQESKSFLLLPEKIKSFSVDNQTSSEYMEWFLNSSVTKESPSFYYYKEAYIALKVSELINCKDYKTAIEIFMTAYIDNNLLVFAIDITEIVDYIKKRINNREIVSIEEVCYISIDKQLEKFLKPSLLNLLDNDFIHQSEPLDYILNCECNDSIKSFFLQNICTIDILKKIYWLKKSSISINEYRIKICQHLLEKYTNINKKELNKEIEDITKRNIIKERIQKIDSSRITIQSNKIQEKVFDEVNDLISRYNSSAKDEKVISSFDYNNPLATTYSFLRQTILCEIYEIYTNAFCFSDYGIDTSLSTRVRHGAFTNQIINVLDNYGFINFDDNSNSKFGALIRSNIFNVDVHCYFEKLYKSVSEIIEHTKKHHLKVVLNDYIEDAIFNYNLSAIEEEELYSNIEAFERLYCEDVFLMLNGFLVKKTNTYLEAVRDDLLPKVLENISNCLDAFNKEILDCINIDYSKYSKIINREIIDCKTELQTEIGNIKQWFYLSENKNWENYSFQDLLEISNEINKKLFVHYSDIVLQVSNVDLTLKGSTFRNFVDIYSILFNNAITHSGFLNKLSDLSITIKTFINSECIHLVFSNNIEPTVDLDILDKKINDLNEIYNTRTFLSINSRQEGGMGLYKIMHMIFSTNQYGKGIMFYRSENTFNVDIQFSKEIIYHDENTAC